MSRKSIIPDTGTSTVVKKIHTLHVYPISGVSEERARKLAEAAGHALEHEDYNRAREVARAISEIGGVRRVDIRAEVVTTKSYLVGAYSVGAYMSERSDPSLDFHYKSGNQPPETRRQKKLDRAEQKRARGQ